VSYNPSFKARANHTGTQAPASISPQGAASGLDADSVDGANGIALAITGPANMAVGSSTILGVSALAAKEDHVHALNAAAPVTVGTANAEGASGSASRADHVHAHGDQTGPTLHADATPSLDGFMPSADKAKLDKFRVVASGQTSVAAASTVDLTTITRNANERLQILGFVTEDTAGIQFSESIDVLAGDKVGYFFERTANAGEVKARATNTHATLARTLDWVILGITP
jgi:hypothetical protein